MKRTALKRTTPLKRTKGLRAVSKKRAKLNREVKPWRDAYRDDTFHCPVCLLGNHWNLVAIAPLYVHEIARGAHRAEAIKHRACCLVVCHDCNCGPLCDYSKWPLERQLALKLITDPDHFDLALFNSVRGRAATAITLRDVVPFLTLRSE